jgi:chemotaxis protein CheD
MTTDGLPVADDAPDRVKVGVAEFAVATGDTLLTTSGLGSCVGVAVADPDAGVAGLAHVMLPEPPEGRVESARPAKSVAVGVERLVTAVEAAGADPDAVEAKLAGGSQMFDFSGVSEGVGQRNVERTRETLTAEGVPIVGEDVGGTYGRSLAVCPETWALTVRSSHEGVVEL